MRIAVCYQDVFPRRGGAETYVYDLCRALIERGHAVTLVASGWDEPARPAGLNTAQLALSARTRVGRIWQFGNHCEQYLAQHAAAFDCSVGFINTWGQDILIPQGGVRAASLEANAQRFAAGPVRAAYRLGKRANARWWVYQAIERRQYDPRFRTRFVAVSQMVREHMQRYHGVDLERVRVIPNAIDAGRLAVPDAAATRRSFRASVGLAENDLAGLFLAHNFKLKGLDPLLEALALRRASSTEARPVHLVVCGGGKAAPYRRRIQRLGLEKTVHMVGFLDDVRAGFHGSDFFVLPSYYDPCSLVVFEALACGLPVVTTRCNGAGEVIEPGVQGAVVPTPGAVADLSTALGLFDDDAKRRAMSAAARALGQVQSFDRHLDALLGWMEAAAAERRARQRHGSSGRPPASRETSRARGSAAMRV